MTDFLRFQPGNRSIRSRIWTGVSFFMDLVSSVGSIATRFPVGVLNVLLRPMEHPWPCLVACVPPRLAKHPSGLLQQSAQTFVERRPGKLTPSVSRFAQSRHRLTRKSEMNPIQPFFRMLPPQHRFDELDVFPSICDAVAHEHHSTPNQIINTKRSVGSRLSERRNALNPQRKRERKESSSEVHGSE